MKIKKSGLYAKFKENEILRETTTLVNITGGTNSSSTGDNDCTRLQGISDCGDNSTSVLEDTVSTGSSSDGCGNP
jgi:hypothetical protein